ncbi:DNA-binding transcriptional response regulator [Rossellomorea marisflavi]|uniref:response regulator n=1 Tax=Rossellomorea marisflavi TaxID=189381 RepID=UPI0011E75367|nr:response regulator [Rossellomorea marisflavi]TYO68699.1 response regulator [Rossellomorea marisflavi]
MSVDRNVLIVDDSQNMEQEIKQYKSIYKKMKESGRYKDLDYNLNLFYEKDYYKAIKILKGKEIIDIVLIDYDITSVNDKTGEDLVKEIRSSINKHCKIIFYTMGELSTVFPDRKEMIELFNQGIFKFLSKDQKSINEFEYGKSTLQVRVEAMIEAIENIDYVQIALEKYFVKYLEIIEDEEILVDGNFYSIQDLISAIRLDKEAGKIYKRNLANSLIIESLESGK